jgi:Protein of unknown function (DUF3137)
MDSLTLIFIVVAIAGIFLFWKVTKFFYKKLAGFVPKTDDTLNFVEGRSTKNAADKFGATLAILEAERQILYNKTKGLFKHTFLRAWVGTWLLFMVMSFILRESEEFDVAIIIGPLFISAFLSLIGAGIYTLIKKGDNLYNFTRKLKQNLVAQMVETINPDLTFYTEGINEEAFDKADIFPAGNNTSFISEDRIDGFIDDSEVTISECIKRGSNTMPTKRVDLKIKGIPIAIGRAEINTDIKSIEYFRGLFVQIQLRNIRFSTPLKIIPQKSVVKEVETGIAFEGSPHFIKDPEPETIIDFIPELDNKSYALYCRNKDEAKAIITPDFIKVLDFIYNKYHMQRNSNSGRSVLGEMLFKEREVFITIHDNVLYMALGWSKDMFEPDRFLKKNLMESGIAQEIYDDLQFVNQVLKEVNLFNKVAV